MDEIKSSNEIFKEKCVKKCTMFLEGGAKSLPFNLVWLDWFGLEWDEMDHQKDIRRENEEEYENVLEEWLLLADHVV